MWGDVWNPVPNNPPSYILIQMLEGLIELRIDWAGDVIYKWAMTNLCSLARTLALILCWPLALMVNVIAPTTKALSTWPDKGE